MSELKAYCPYANRDGFYHKSEVDKVLAEKDNEIYNQKWRGDEWARNCNQKDKEIESLKASHYAEMVDAGMRERRLRMALWLARASEASKEVNYWTCQDESSYAIVDFNVRHETIISYKAPHHRPYKWVQIWENVERKCREKAEQYK